MKRTIVLICLFLGLVYTNRCVAKDKLNILTTTTNLASIAEAVGGEYVNVSCLATGDEDPHFIEAKPSFMLKAKKADLWICVGLDMEIGYERLILEGSRNPRIHAGSAGHLDASEGITPLEVPSGKIDRSLGDVHPSGNPHYWLDPYNGKIIAKNICQRLKKLDPDNANDYERNLAEFNSNLDKAMAGWIVKLKSFEHAKIITYHRSWPYFASRFNLDIVAELEPKPGIPPGPKHILEVINTTKTEKAKVILMEPFYNRDDAEAVANKTGAKVVVVPNAPNEQTKDYIAMLDNVVNKLADALSEGTK